MASAGLTRPCRPSSPPVCAATRRQRPVCYRRVFKVLKDIPHRIVNAFNDGTIINPNDIRAASLDIRLAQDTDVTDEDIFTERDVEGLPAFVEDEVDLDSEVEAFEFFCVVEVIAHWIK